MYKFHNANSKGRFVNDCVIRAVSFAENKDWEETYEELSDIAKEQGILLDDVRFVEPLLDSRYKRICFCDKTVGEFILTHQKGTWLITMPNHISVIRDGILFDTFDCRNRYMKCAWKVEH